MDTVAYTDAGFQQVKRTDQLLNWKLVILVVVLLTSYIDSSDQSEIVTCCRGGNASFTWDYKLPPFIVIEWYVNDTQIAETSEPSFSQNVLDINSDYTRRFRLHKIGAIGFDIINVTEEDEGDYRCLVTSETGILKELKKKLQVKGNYFGGIKLGDYNVTVTNTTEDCRTLKCGEPVGTNTTYEWSIRVNGSDEKPIRTSTNTFKFCRKTFNCSVKCQRDHDCTETTWICFKRQSGRRRRKRRTLDEQHVPCGEDKDSDEDTDSGNLDDSSPITPGIAVAVGFAVIAVIAILTVVTLRKLRSRAGRRSDSFKVKTPASTECHELMDKTYQPEEKRDGELEELKDSKHLQDKETCEQVNLNQTTWVTWVNSVKCHH